MANGGSWEASTPLPQAPADKRPGHVGSWRDPRGGELLDQAGRRAGGVVCRALKGRMAILFGPT